MKLLKVIKDKDLGDDFKTREASRGVIFDENNLVPILFVSTQNYHKLPGGGIEKGEDRVQALKREVKEEVGCTIEDEKEIGEIVEYRYFFSDDKLKQTSYCYLGKIVSKGGQELEQGEIDEGFELKWLTLDQAINTLETDTPKIMRGNSFRKEIQHFSKRLKG
jgi:8-oxo-dGTP pyrophosphatase MutT (NUDIX family)